MDKYEYKLKTEQMLEFMEDETYDKAAEIADIIDWRRVKNASMLISVSDIYEMNGEIQKSYEILKVAYERAAGGRKVVYRLGNLALKMGDINEAIEYYDEFVENAPKDPNQYILRYEILRKQNAPIEEQIESLEEFKKAEYTEKWSYELAKLYQEAGMTAECLEECDDLILWFSEGTYVYQAMELKMQYKPLTPSQLEKYNHRYDGKKEEEQKPVFKKPDSNSNQPVVADKIVEAVAAQESIEKSEDDIVKAEPEEESEKQQEATGGFIKRSSIFGATMALGDAINSLVHGNDKKNETIEEAESDDIYEDEIDDDLVEDEAESAEEVKQEQKPAPKKYNLMDAPTMRLPDTDEILARLKEERAERMNNKAVGNVKATEEVDGQMSKNDTLNDWEDEAQEPAKAKEAESILPEDIQRMIDEIENGVSIAPVQEQPVRRSMESEVYENKGESAQDLRIAEDYDDYDEAFEEEDLEEGFEDDAFEDDEFEEDYEADEYEESDYEDEDLEDEDYEEDDYEESDYEDEDLEEEDYEESEYEESDEYEDEDLEEEDYEEDEYEESDDYEDEDLEEEDYEEDEFEEEDYEDEFEEEGYEEDEFEEEDYEGDEFEDDDYEDDDSEADDYEDDDYEDDGSELEDYEEDAFEGEDYENEHEEDGYEDEPDEDELFQKDLLKKELFDEKPDKSTDQIAEEVMAAAIAATAEGTATAAGTVGAAVPKKRRKKRPRPEKEEQTAPKRVKKAPPIDDREIPDEQEIDVMTQTAPLSRKETAKMIATGKTAPLPIDEISNALSMSDTGFIVHGRYDLETQSGIGTRAGLTEDQKKLFSYFVPVRGMSEQLVDVLEQDKNCTNRKGTSVTGNLLIIGRKGSGKTVLAVDVVKAIQKQRKIKQGKVAIVTGDSLNKKRISEILEKLYGGALIIEKAGKMNEKTVARLNKAMERDTGELLIVLEEQRKPLDRLLTSNRDFRRKFTARLEVPIFINDELVTFGQTYARENGYRIDEMGILALYSRIDALQREDHAVTVSEVKEIMDEAQEHSQKASAKKLVRRVFGKSTDSTDRIILTEKDFNI